jgi:tetratricopeptide (TPR) repeat protein
MKFNWSIFLIAFYLVACDRYNPVNDQIYDLPRYSAANQKAILQALQDAVANYPESAENHYKLAAFYFKNQQDILALDFLKKTLQLDSTQAKYYLSLAQVYDRLQQVEPAMQAVIKSQNSEETNYEALVLAGHLYYQKKEYDNAIKYLNKALKITQVDARVYYFKANVEIARYDSANALKNLAAALQRKPAYYEVYNSYANLFIKFEMYNTAIRYANQGLKINPQSDLLHFNKAEAFRLQRFFEDSARIYYEKAFQINSKLDKAAYYAGVYAYERGKYQIAQKYMESSLQNNPKFAKTHYYLGMCLRYYGKKKEALKAFGQAIKLDTKDLIAGEMYWQVKNDIFNDELRAREDSMQRAYYKMLEEQRKKEQEMLKKLYEQKN